MSTLDALEEKIRELLTEGWDEEDIADETAKMLNLIRKEQEEKKKKKREEAKKTSAQLRNERIDELWEDLDEHYETSVNYEDVGILAALVFAPDYPSWTVENIDEFKDAAVEVLKLRAEMIGKNSLDGMRDVLTMVKNKSKDTDECGSCCKKEIEDVLKKDLEKLRRYMTWFFS